jgi:hypothetical protein
LHWLVGEGDAAGVLIEFRHARRGESLAWIHRPDGVVVLLPSYSRKHRVPHDIAHAVTEREFGMAQGVFGSIAAGAVFENMRVVSGRPRHDARAISARVLRANSRALAVAEALSGVLHRAVEERQPAPKALLSEAWGVISAEPFPWTDADIASATEVLRGFDERWCALPADGTLEFDWPRRLIRSERVSSRHPRSA